MLVVLMGHLSGSLQTGHPALREAASWVRILVDNRLDFSTSRGRTEVKG
jgi:hypothetical protein